VKTAGIELLFDASHARRAIAARTIETGAVQFDTAGF
jgi:hypothetical protein